MRTRQRIAGRRHEELESHAETTDDTRYFRKAWNIGHDARSVVGWRSEFGRDRATSNSAGLSPTQIGWSTSTRPPYGRDQTMPAIRTRTRSSRSLQQPRWLPVGGMGNSSDQTARWM